MRKTYIIILAVLAVLCAVPVHGQFFGPAKKVFSDTSDPAACQPEGNNVFINRNSTSILKICVSTNTWVGLPTLAGGTYTGAPVFSSGLVLNGTEIVSEAVNVTAVKNLTSGQSFRIYNTTDTTGTTAPANFERALFGWSGNIFLLRVLAGTGTGSSRSMQIGVPTGQTLGLQVNSSDVASISGTGIVVTGTLSASGTVTVSGPSLQSSSTKTLTESAATAFAAITVASSAACSGYVDYTVFAADATNTQAKSGMLHFSVVANSSGTVTAASPSDVNTLNPVSSGTLTNTMTGTTGANSYTLNADAASSLTQTTLNIKYLVRVTSGTCTVTAQ